MDFIANKIYELKEHEELDLKTNQSDYMKLKKLVEYKKGILLTEYGMYKSDDTKMKIECKCGFKFNITHNKILANRWCPSCEEFSHENETKKLAELLLKKPFAKVYPKWLLNSRGNQMELDMYNEELKLGIEFNGQQHYEFTKVFHKDEKDLMTRIKDDKKKLQLCKDNGVKLLVVPYDVNMKEHLLNNFIDMELL